MVRSLIADSVRVMQLRCPGRVSAQLRRAHQSQPLVAGFIDTGITNARTEATNRMIKDAARIASGFRNLHSQRRRVQLHCKKTTIGQPLRR